MSRDELLSQTESKIAARGAGTVDEEQLLPGRARDSHIKRDGIMLELPGLGHKSWIWVSLTSVFGTEYQYL